MSQKPALNGVHDQVRVAAACEMPRDRRRLDELRTCADHAQHFHSCVPLSYRSSAPEWACFRRRAEAAVGGPANRNLLPVVLVSLLSATRAATLCLHAEAARTSAAPSSTDPIRDSGGRSLVLSITKSLRVRLPGVSPAAIGGTLATRLLATGMSFAAGVIAARALGVEGRATFAVMISVPSVLSIVTVLGVDNANARFAGTSHTAFRQIVRWSLVFSMISGSALAGLWLLLAHLWPPVLLGVPYWLALLVAAMCPVSLLTTLLGMAELGRGRVAMYNLLSTVPAAGYLLGVCGLSAAGSLTPTSCFLSVLAGQLVCATMLLIASTTRVHADGEPVAARTFGSFALRSYLPNLIHYGMLRLDVPVIQTLAGATAVAVYAVALPLAEGLLLLSTTVALVMFPAVTSGAVDARAAAKIARTVFVAAATTAVVAAAAAPLLIPAVYGQPYSGAVPVIWAMLPGLVLFSAARSVQPYLAAAGLLRPVITGTVIGAVVNIALLVALTPHHGAVGAGAADSAGYLVFAVLLVLGVRRAVRARRRHRAEYTGDEAPARVPAGRLSVKAVGDLWRAACSRLGKPVLADRALMIRAGLLTVTGVGCLATVFSPALSAAGAAGAAMLVVVVLALIPEVGLCVLGAAIPLSQSDLGNWLITPSVLVALMLVCLLGRVIAGLGIARPKPLSVLITVGTVGYMVTTSVLIGDADPMAADKWQYLLLMCAPLMLLPLVAEPGRALDRALLVFCGGSVVVALVDIVRIGSVFAAKSSLAAADTAVLAITQEGAANHNAAGALFVMAAAVLLRRYPTVRGRLLRLATGAGVVVLALGVAYSLSRAAYLAGIAVIVLYAARRSLRGVLATSVGAACLLPLLPAAIAARFDSILGGAPDVNSAVRLDLWSSALRMFEAHPALGVGYLNFAHQLPAYYQATGDYEVMLLQFPLLHFAHNTYLTVLSQTGLVGTLGIGSLVVFGLRRAWRATRTGDPAGEAALLAMVGAGVCSLFGEVLLVPPLLAGLMLIVLATKPAPADRPVAVAR
ncbi:O-antigen ligase family protein [Streptomyces indiaensis]|uniref:O-antigen ligase family protein n=1 Tax=Streptomyces indiaensis TaxID=284033 RepID=UPI001F39B039|nr:O-antigen ligase family protein [Streptomyces indiaensis]MCF1645400.1 O-antigen ligase family protein [Streptomyces indiaensis]